MNKFLLNFVKVTGSLPAWIYLKQKLYSTSDAARELMKNGPAIVISNHRKLIDYMLMLTLFPFRNIRFLMAEVLFRKNKLTSWFFKYIGGIRIDRNNAADAGYLYEIMQTLENGDMIGVFPEGRLNAKGELLEFKTGAAYFALKTGYPILPIYHDGNYGLFRRVRAIVGDPIYLRSRFEGEITPELLLAASEFLRDRVIELRAELEQKRREQTRLRAKKSLTFKFMSAFLRVHLQAGLALGYRPKISYLDKSVQSRKLKEPTIVIANHTDFSDPPMLCYVFPRAKLHIQASAELYEKSPSLGWLLDRCRCIKIDRESLDMDAFRESLRVLREGDSVGIFPEGRIVKEDMGLLPFKAGPALLALKSGAPILPVYIDGPQKVFGKRLKITVGVPIRLEKEPPTEECLERISIMLKNSLTELSKISE